MSLRFYFAALLLILGTSNSIAVAQAPDVAGRMGRRLIQFGWGETNPRFIRSRIEQMEKMPFDGLVLSAQFKDRDGKIRRFEWDGFGSKRIRDTDLQDSLADLKATPFVRFTDNFVRVNVTPGDVDWFDNFGTVLRNLRGIGGFAREGDLKGVFFDVETYKNSIFSYKKQKYRKKKSFAQYAARVRARGIQVVKSLQRNNPRGVIFLSFGHDKVFHGSITNLKTHKYGLLPAFLDGMIAGATDGTEIVNGFEESFGFMDPKQFNYGYRKVRGRNLLFTADPKRYRDLISVGFGLWMDHSWKEKGWNLKDVERNKFSPERFKTAVTSALRQTDKYVWIYSQQARWWTDDQLPPSYVDAVRQARIAAGMIP